MVEVIESKPYVCPSVCALAIELCDVWTRNFTWSYIFVCVSQSIITKGLLGERNVHWGNAGHNAGLITGKIEGKYLDLKMWSAMGSRSQQVQPSHNCAVLCFWLRVTRRSECLRLN